MPTYTIDSSSCGSTTTTWTVWNDAYTTTSNAGIWTTWVTGTITGTVTVYVTSTGPSEEEITRRAAAHAKAEIILKESLSDAQQEEMERERYFTVESRTSKRRYRIRRGGIHGNIREVDDQGNELRSICCAPRGNIPEADAILGQKLFLEHAEEEFLRTANITELRRAAA